MVTIKELLEMQEKGLLGKTRKRSSYDEHNLQCSEVRYIRGTHPELSRIFFAVPNGQKRTSRQTAWMHDEGLVNGVSDMILLRPNIKHGYLCIENKTKTGRQSEAQKLFQESVEENGGLYVIVRSLDEFTILIDNYLKGII